MIREGVVETGEVTPEIIDVLPLPDEQRGLLRELELRSYVTVPLSRPQQADRRVCRWRWPSRAAPIGEREIELAQELGARAGIALENARLYQTADARRAELDAVLAALAEAVLVFDGAGQAAHGQPGRAARRSAARCRRRWTSCGHASGMTAAGVPDARAAGRRPSRSRSTAAVAGTSCVRTWPDEPERTATSPTVVVMRDITEVRAARAARDAFMGVLSHELRTPITTIYGGSELLARDLDEEQRAEVIADIRAESERLARLVEDLLVMTRVERGIVEIADEPILLQHLLASVILSATARVARGAHNAARRGPPAGGPRRRDVHRTGRAQPADQRRALRRRD